MWEMRHLLHLVLSPRDDLVLHLEGELHEVGAEAGYPDDQVPVLLRVSFGGQQGLPVRYGYRLQFAEVGLAVQRNSG